ncbi:MAG: hypothetical protein BGO63_10435 [Candidatus Accumulibacter sp. 66-26]|nr:MAG: hypothetical protein BGO63_10435 [Candidatus Accumulibacter sp. 66-26]
MVALRPGVVGQGQLGCCMGREILDGLPRYWAFVVLRADVVTGSATQDLQGQFQPGADKGEHAMAYRLGR